MAQNQFSEALTIPACEMQAAVSGTHQKKNKNRVKLTLFLYAALLASITTNSFSFAHNAGRLKPMKTAASLDSKAVSSEISELHTQSVEVEALQSTNITDPKLNPTSEAPYAGISSEQVCPARYAQIANDRRFDPYFGDTKVFHGGYRGFVGKQKAVDNLYPECFYDDGGRLIDANHVDAACAGSANEYKADGLTLNTLRHWFYDRGGPIDLKRFTVTKFAVDGYFCAANSTHSKHI